MKLICKDYYKYSRQPKLLNLFKKALDEKYYVRESILVNCSFVPLSVFNLLSNDKHWEVRERMASRLDCPIIILHLLCVYDKVTGVRVEASLNPTYKDFLTWRERDFNMRDKHTYERSIEDYIRHRSRCGLL